MGGGFRTCANRDQFVKSKIYNTILLSLSAPLPHSGRRDTLLMMSVPFGAAAQVIERRPARDHDAPVDISMSDDNLNLSTSQEASAQRPSHFICKVRCMLHAFPGTKNAPNMQAPGTGSFRHSRVGNTACADMAKNPGHALALIGEARNAMLSVDRLHASLFAGGANQLSLPRALVAEICQILHQKSDKKIEPARPTIALLVICSLPSSGHLQRSNNGRRSRAPRKDVLFSPR